jgi:hypothetical protein
LELLGSTEEKLKTVVPENGRVCSSNDADKILEALIWKGEGLVDEILQGWV